MIMKNKQLMNQSETECYMIESYDPKGEKLKHAGWFGSNLFEPERILKMLNFLLAIISIIIKTIQIKISKDNNVFSYGGNSVKINN